jgi:hypothetical protein
MERVCSIGIEYQTSRVVQHESESFQISITMTSLQSSTIQLTILTDSEIREDYVVLAQANNILGGGYAYFGIDKAPTVLSI